MLPSSYLLLLVVLATDLLACSTTSSKQTCLPLWYNFRDGNFIIMKDSRVLLEMIKVPLWSAEHSIEL